MPADSSSPERSPPAEPLSRTPLYTLHQELGARFVPFAGFEMPVQYPDGVLKEHLHTRAGAGLFDVSHMGQIRLVGSGADAALETLVPGDIRSLAPGATRYTLLLNDAGGIDDDLMVTRRDGHLRLVVNAATKHADLARLRAALPSSITIVPEFDLALLALQGPAAAAVAARLAPGLAALDFMQAADAILGGIPVIATRSGYTGEDGYEFSVAPGQAEALARLLLAEPEVAAIGLGARDSLRLEAGLCLYGHDIDTTTSPIEASLAWTIAKRRRAEGGFPGAARVLSELSGGVSRRRVGVLPEGKAPAREHTPIETPDGRPAGTITSGGFGPSVSGPVAMGYVETALAAPNTPVNLTVRGTPRPARITPLPFFPHRYFRAAKA